MHNKKPVQRILSLCLAIAIVLGIAIGTIVPAFAAPTKDMMVTDNAGMLTAEQESEIEDMLYVINQRTGVELAVYTIETLNGQDIETKANDLFRELGLGDSEKNNGLLLLIAINDRKFRLEVGYGLEGAIPDTKAAEIINTMTPYFKESNYADVIKEGSKGSKKAMDRETELKAYNALCKYFFDARTFGMVNTSFSGSSVIGKIKGAFQLSMPVSFDPVNIIPMTITRCCVSSDAERIGAEKDSKKKNVNTDEDGESRKNPKDRMMGRRSFVEYGLYHMSIQINSMMAQRNGITMDDVNLLIDALQHMFENDISSGRALTLRKLIVVEHTKPMGNVPRDTIENALTATLKIPDDCPTSYNDYIVTFHRNLLPKEVKVTEYGIDGSSKVML